MPDEVNSQRTGIEKSKIVPRVTDWFDNAAKFDCSYGRAGEQRREEEMVARTDDRQVVRQWEALDKSECRKARPENKYARLPAGLPMRH